MRISDFLTENRVVILKGGTKSAVIEEMIDSMADSLEGISREILADAVYKREGLMSTGIGLGIAIPHVRLEGIINAYASVGISREGIGDYESIDGEPVNVIVLIAAPQGRHDIYIKLLAKFVNLLKEPSLIRRLIDAETTSEIFSALTESEE